MNRIPRSARTWATLALSILSAVVLGCAIAKAGDVVKLEPGDESLHLLPPNAVLIHNSTGRSIQFYLASAGEPGELASLKDDELRMFSDGSSEAYTIEVFTQDRGSVHYDLQGSQRYQIYWNASRGVWDVIRLTTR